MAPLPPSLQLFFWLSNVMVNDKTHFLYCESAHLSTPPKWQLFWGYPSSSTSVNGVRMSVFVTVLTWRSSSVPLSRWWRHHLENCEDSLGVTVLLLLCIPKESQLKNDENVITKSTLLCVEYSFGRSVTEGVPGIYIFSFWAMVWIAQVVSWLIFTQVQKPIVFTHLNIDEALSIQLMMFDHWLVLVHRAGIPVHV